MLAKSQVCNWRNGKGVNGGEAVEQKGMTGVSKKTVLPRHDVGKCYEEGREPMGRGKKGEESSGRWELEMTRGHH